MKIKIGKTLLFKGLYSDITLDLYWISLVIFSDEGLFVFMPQMLLFLTSPMMCLKCPDVT